MSGLGRFALKIKRGETPLYRLIRRIAKWLFRANLPVPRLFTPFFRFLYQLHFSVATMVRRILIFFYGEPIFRARCASAGKNLTMWGIPYVVGHTEIHIGDDVTINGRIFIASGRFLDHPRLIIQDRAQIGAHVAITVNQEVVIEEEVIISPHCRIADSDGHPKEADLRAQHAPLTARDMRPVRICRRAWVGSGAQVMKGVTIGEGAIIGANSVVVSDIPPYCLAMGNPAEVYFRNVGKPKRQAVSVSQDLPPARDETARSVES